MKDCLCNAGPVPLGSHEGMQSVIGGDMHSSLTDLDAESAAANAEVLAVSSAALTFPACHTSSM